MSTVQVVIAASGVRFSAYTLVATQSLCNVVMIFCCFLTCQSFALDYNAS